MAKAGASVASWLARLARAWHFLLTGQRTGLLVSRERHMVNMGSTPVSVQISQARNENGNGPLYIIFPYI